MTRVGLIEFHDHGLDRSLAEMCPALGKENVDRCFIGFDGSDRRVHHRKQGLPTR